MPQENPAPPEYEKWHAAEQFALFNRMVRDAFQGRLGWDDEQMSKLTMQEVTEYFAYRDAVTKANG